MNLSTDSLKDAGFDLATGFVNELRHRRSNQRARLALKGVETQQGATDSALINRCNEYAQDVLGSRRYAPWLHVYSAVSGEFKEGWIPDNYYGLVVYPMKNPVAAKLSILKTLTNRILDTEALPDLAYVIDGVYFSRDFRPIQEPELVAILFDRHDRAYFKADDSNQGRSIVIMTRKDFQDGGRPVLPDGVFQAPIRQHEFFEALSPKATATVRITSARGLDGTIAVKAAYLRMGRSSDDIVRSASAVKVPLDRNTGALGDFGYLPDWHRVDTHPDTGFRFSGSSVPHFLDAIALCQSLHERCPHMPCVGWDVCSDRDGKIQIMEWNAYHNDIKFSEATTGPCFRGLGWETLWRRAAS
jgi:hypothetical protein